MVDLSRRTVVKRLTQLGAALTALVHATPTKAQQSQGAQSPTPGTVTPRSAAIAALRYINTIENAYFRDTGTHGEIEQVLLTPLAQTMLLTIREKSGRQPVDPSAHIAGGDLVAGFDLSFLLGQNGRGYAVTLTPRSGGLGFSTDQDGVIFQGTGIGQAFRGEPLIPPLQVAARPENGMRKFAATILAFYFPTASAQPGYQCCHGLCGGICVSGSCSCPGGTLCCNLGYQVCTWCCSTNTSCYPCIYYC
jgi:hypothetical protein